jgi:hypothetical protein
LEYTHLLRQGAHNDELRKGDASTAVRKLSPAMLRAGEKELWPVLAGSGGEVTPGGWCGLISDVAIARRRALRAPLAWNLAQKAHR